MEIKYSPILIGGMEMAIELGNNERESWWITNTTNKVRAWFKKL